MEIDLHQMEIHVHLGGEELGNNLEGTSGGVRGRTKMAEYHGGLYMEHSKGTQNEAPLHPIQSGAFFILEFKRMSDVTDQYLIRGRSRVKNQYESLRRVLGATLQHQG